MFCKHCGKPVDNSTAQCPYCFGMLTPAAASARPAPAPAPEPKPSALSSAFSAPSGFASAPSFGASSEPAAPAFIPPAPASVKAEPAPATGFAPAAGGFGVGADLPPAFTASEDFGVDDTPFITDTQPTRISSNKEIGIFFRQNFLIMINDWKNLCISLAFPVIAAIIVIAIAGGDMFDNYESTKSGAFVVVSAAIWGGLFNSIQTVVKERANIRRDYMAGVRISSQIVARVILQMILCAIQSFILNLSLLGVELVHGNDLPSSGILGGSVLFETFISIFLLMYAADMMGLMFSCMVRKSETANVMAPYILIVQLIFSGILFEMEGFAETISYLMLSRWGMEALGSSCELNDLPSKIVVENPQLASMLTTEAQDMFESSTEHLLLVWCVLILFSVAFVAVGAMMLRNVDKDKR